MKSQLIQTGFTRALAIAIVTMQLVACGGGGGSGSSAGSENVTSAASTGSTASKNTVTTASDSGSSGSSSAPAVSTGRFMLEWTAPVSRTDGTPLSLADISGFRIYYGKSAGNYENVVNVSDGTAQAATVKNVPVGTYQVVMTTYDNNGRESGYSEKISKNVL